MSAAEEQEQSGMDDLPGMLRPVVWSLCILLVAFQIYTAGFGQLPPLSQRAVHVGIGLLIVYLWFTRRQEGRELPAWLRMADMVAGLLALGSCAYILTQETRITESFGVIARPEELVLGSTLTLLLLVAAWRTTGPALPIMAVLMLLYTVFGEHIPGYWGHTGFDFQYLIEHLFLGTEGIWGTVTGLSANLIAIFIIFGAFLLATGAARTFMDIALVAAGRFPGGAAKVATVSSALFGMLNGAAVANVATTGAFTIPAMKRLGYRPAFAGAVEATASSGGQITPPIMGAGAFVMAELLSVPYTDIVYAAAIPAFLFFVCVWMSIDVEARREDMKAFDAADIPSAREIFAPRRVGPLAATLVVTLGSMFSGNTPTLAAFYGICINVGLYLLLGKWSFADMKLRVGNILQGCTAAAVSITSILALLVTAQIALSLVGLTGLGIKLSESIIGVGDGSLFAGVLLSMTVALVLGMGMPTTAAYLLAAAVAAPALITLGIEPLIAHFVVFYSALLSALTPPVCTAVFTAAVIARTHWWPICVSSMRLALMKYALPLFFVFRPSVLLQGTTQEIIWSMAMGMVASMLMAIGGGRFYRRPVGLPLAILLILAGALVAADHWWVDVLALALLGSVMSFQRYRNWKERSAGEGAAAINSK